MSFTVIRNTTRPSRPFSLATVEYFCDCWTRLRKESVNQLKSGLAIRASCIGDGGLDEWSALELAAGAPVDSVSGSVSRTAAVLVETSREGLTAGSSAGTVEVERAADGAGSLDTVRGRFSTGGATMDEVDVAVAKGVD